jgi:hypothetical protein
MAAFPDEKQKRKSGATLVAVPPETNMAIVKNKAFLIMTRFQLQSESVCGTSQPFNGCL